MSCNTCGGGDPFKKGCGDDKCLCILKIRDNDDCTGTICTEGGNIDFQMPPVAPINGPLSDAEGLQSMLNITSECLKELKEAEDDAGTDDQTAAEVLMASGETVEDCVTDLKTRMTAVEGNAIAAFTNINGVVTITEVDGDAYSINLPVLSEQQNPNGTTSLLVDGTVVHTTPLFTANTAADGTHELYSNGVLVGTWDDADTVSSPHPEYTLTKDAATGEISLVQDGVVVATVADNDTVSTPHPEITFAPNATNGTDVLIDGTVVYTIPDTDVVINETVNADGSTTYEFVEGGNVVGTLDTMPDTDQGFVLGTPPVTQNADGSTNLCLTTVWVTHPTIAAGTPVSTVNDACWTVPTNDVSDNTLVVDAAGNIVGTVTEGGNDYVATLPIAALLSTDDCQGLKVGTDGRLLYEEHAMFASVTFTPVVSADWQVSPPNVFIASPTRTVTVNNTSCRDMRTCVWTLGFRENNSSFGPSVGTNGRLFGGWGGSTPVIISDIENHVTHNAPGAPALSIAQDNYPSTFGLGPVIPAGGSNSYSYFIDMAKFAHPLDAGQVAGSLTNARAKILGFTL